VWGETEEPSTGANFPLWRKQVETCSGDLCGCEDGVKSGGNCYTYEILSRLCATVGLLQSDDKKTYYLTYAGGCYADGDVGFYTRAQPGKRYEFNSIPIEVREKDDPYVAFSQTNYDFGEENMNRYFYISCVAILAAMVLSIAATVVYFRQKDGQKGLL